MFHIWNRGGLIGRTYCRSPSSKRRQCSPRLCKNPTATKEMENLLSVIYTSKTEFDSSVSIFRSARFFLYFQENLWASCCLCPFKRNAYLFFLFIFILTYLKVCSCDNSLYLVFFHPKSEIFVASDLASLSHMLIEISDKTSLNLMVLSS